MADDLTDVLLDALIATPLGNAIQRRRTKRLTAEYQAGQSVTVPASYCARPQDSRRSGASGIKAPQLGALSA